MRAKSTRLVDLAPLLGPRKKLELKNREDQIDEFVTQHWQASPHIIRRLEDHNMGKHPKLKRANAISETARLTGYIQDQEIIKITSLLDSQNIPHVWLKGVATRWITGAGRIGRDIDLAVLPNDIDRVKTIMQKARYLEAEWDAKVCEFVTPDLNRRTMVEANHYELGYLVHPIDVSLPKKVSERVEFQIGTCSTPWSKRNSSLVAYIVCDVHHGLNLDISTRDIINSATRINGISVPSIAWCLALTVYKLYWEGVHTYCRGAYQYLDVCALTESGSEHSHLEAIRILDHMGIKVGAAYVFRRLPIFGIELSEPLQSLVNGLQVPKPGTSPLDFADRGDHWCLIWGLRWLQQ